MKKNVFTVMLMLFLINCLALIGCTSDKKSTNDKPKVKIVNSIEAAKNTAIAPYTIQSIPVLMYHSIGVEKGNPIVMPKEQFEEEMKYIKEHGYTTLNLKELYDYFQNKKPVPKKSVVITLDDGYENNYTDAYPILKKYNLKANVFIITGEIGKNSPYMTKEQIIEMEKNGIEFESHTVTHRDLDSLSYSEQLQELKTSREELGKITGRSIDFIAYPSGKFNASTVKAAEEAGYTMAFTTNGRWSNKSNGMLTLDRVYISTFHPMTTFIERLTNPNYKIN